jgi:uncharacterized membrane protein HdeD (DUF308 family)
MTYKPQTKWSLFRFAVRHSCKNAAVLTVLFGVLVVVRAITTTHPPISFIWALTWFAAFYLFALTLEVLRWYTYVARTKRAARKKGWGD